MDDYQFFEVLYQNVTPLHIGCGADVGIVDLPIERERATGFPIVPGSGIRGSLRARTKAEGNVELDRLMGPESGDLTSGCVSVLDARILLFPVRSAPGIFHWVTCPFVVRRYLDDRAAFLGPPCSGPVLPEYSPAENQYFGASTESPLYLEEFPFKPPEGGGGWSWTHGIAGVDSARVVLVDDEAFRYFVEHATMVVTRNRLTSEKTVADGPLFSIEAVPPEAVFYGFFGVVEERSTREERWRRDEVAAQLHEGWTSEAGKPSRRYLHLGGEESVGWGVTRLTWLEPPKADARKEG